MARRQLAAGAVGLCAATVGEAAAFAAGGVTDLTLAYPVVGARKLERLAAVCRAADLTLVADSTAVADGYQEVARQAGRTLRVLIEVDTGMGRVGATPTRRRGWPGTSAAATGWSSTASSPTRATRTTPRASWASSGWPGRRRPSWARYGPSWSGPATRWRWSPRARR